MRVCHYGYLANRVQVEKLKQIREYLEAAQPVKTVADNPSDNPAGEYSSLNEAEKSCPGCKTGYLHLVGLIPSEKER